MPSNNSQSNPVPALPIWVDGDDLQDRVEDMKIILGYVGKTITTPPARNCVYFYSHQSGPYRCFSNFLECAKGENCLFKLTHGKDTISGYIKLDSEKEYSYSSAEQAIMHLKAVIMGDELAANAIMKSSDPSTAKRLGRTVKGFQQELWDKHVSDIAYAVLYAKFVQNPGLKRVLLSTMGKVIAEASPGDRVWGIGRSVVSAMRGGPWRGRNVLGLALMRVRDNIVY